jgi:hypothetical protein
MNPLEVRRVAAVRRFSPWSVVVGKSMPLFAVDWL